MPAAVLKIEFFIPISADEKDATSGLRGFGQLFGLFLLLLLPPPPVMLFLRATMLTSVSPFSIHAGKVMEYRGLDLHSNFLF